MFDNNDISNPIIKSTSDNEYVYNIKVDTQFSDEHKKAIESADKWLEDISDENINIDKWLKTSADEEESEESDSTSDINEN